MENTSKFILCSLFAILLLHQANSTTLGNGCANMSSKWEDLGGNYCYIIEENATVSWIDAEYQCFREGGSLASFHSITDVERVVDNVDDQKKRFYIGLHRNRKGRFEWVDKSTLDFTNWYPGEPNLEFEKCVEIYIASGMWNDLDCRDQWGYVCSAPKYSPPRDQTKVCPKTSSKWEDLGGDACYIIEKENKVTWTDALIRCFEDGGFLASFHSVGEVSAVLQRARSYDTGYHIGLRQDDNGTYHWADGSVVDFDYWGTTFRFSSWDASVTYSTDEQCGEMNTHDGRWSNVYCEKPSGYICSSPKVVDNCGGDIEATAGVLQSPHYPQHYGPGEKCVWNIRAPENYRISLKFNSFELEGSYDCLYDFVEVRDGHESDSPVLGKFCGTDIPDPLHSSTNKIAVEFVSDEEYERHGFILSFEKVAIPARSLASILEEISGSLFEEKVRNAKAQIL